jgi:hypothetical protein
MRAWPKLAMRSVDFVLRIVRRRICFAKSSQTIARDNSSASRTIGSGSFVLTDFFTKRGTHLLDVGEVLLQL